MPRADPTPGELVSRYRAEKNWSRNRLAGQMHKSVSWVAKVERNELPLVDITVLGRLAALLGATQQEFIEAALGPDTETVRNRPYVEQLRLAIAGHPAPDSIITPVVDGPPCDLESLRQRTLHIWERIHASAYRKMGPAIATLISELENASRTAAKTSGPISFCCWPRLTKPLRRCWSKSATEVPDGWPPTAPSPQPNEATTPP